MKECEVKLNNILLQGIISCAWVCVYIHTHDVYTAENYCANFILAVTEICELYSSDKQNDIELWELY